MSEFQVVYVKSDKPFERGVQYGEQAKEKIQAGVKNYREYFESKGKSWEETCRLAMTFVPEIERSMPEILEEAKGIAKGAEVSIEGLMVLNTRYELTAFLDMEKPKECTTGAVLPEAGRDGKTFMVKNWDYRPGVLDKIVILHLEDGNGTKLMGLTEAGQMLREGFNSNGIGLCNNFIGSIWDGPGVGIPVCFLRRRVLASRTFDEAYSWLTGIKRCVSNNMMLVSAEGKAIDIEASPRGCDLLKPIGGILTHANHFVIDPDKDHSSWKHSLGRNRDIRLADLFHHRRGTIDVEYIMECMRDHEYYPDSICNHNNSSGTMGMKGIMTVASMIVDFREGCAYICKGNPCTGTYKKYEL